MPFRGAMAKPNQISGYRILAKLGTGAASQLYAVQDTKTKQVWALKHVVKEDEKDQRFIDQVEVEYDVGRQMDHPYLRQIHKLIKHRKRLRVHAVSLVMELVDAQTIDQRLPKTHGEAVRLLVEVASALAHMHERGFIHADIKPSNVLVTGENDVKIIDLGQACKAGTVKKRIQGTPGYMAPEQAHRQAITAQTDIFNLGAMMYWLLVREVIPTAMPPKEENGNSLYTGAIDANHLMLPAPPHVKDPTIHPLLSKQVMDCIQLDPDDRPESMEAVRKRLELTADLLENPPEAGTIIDEETMF